MRIRFIEEGNETNILTETENTEILNAVFVPYTQIHIAKEDKMLICEHNYNVIRVQENELDIYVTVTDTDSLN